MFKWLVKNKKKVLFSLLAAFIVLLLLNQYLGSRKDNNFVVHEVEHQDLAQYLSETGTVKQGQEVLLSFNQTGRIDKLSVYEGKDVEAGEILISLDRESLLIELERAQESLALAQADYQKLMTGLSAEELRYYQATLENAEISLNNAQDSLIETQDKKEEVEKQVLAERDGLYDTALSAARQSIDTGLNSLLFLVDIQQDYFAVGTRDALALSMARGQAAFSLLGAENSIYWSKASLLSHFGGARQLVQEADSVDETDSALTATIEALKDVKTALDTVNIAGFSSSDLSTLNTEKASINTALASLSSQEQLINAHWVNSDVLIKSAERAIQAMERQVGTAKGSYQLALAQWEMKSGSPRLEDEILYSARVGQAQAGVKLAERRLEEAVLRAPFRGRVVEILKQEDEITQISQPVVRLRPLASFQIEADIYEGDIGQIEVGQDVQIKLIAFPDIILSGQVSFVDSSSQLINNVVYYPIKVDLDDSDHNIQAGLTADIKVLLESRENVLTVPESSLRTEEGKTFVRVLSDQKEVEEREVEAGMRGEGFRVEIISGLSAGEKVIVR